MRELFLLAVLFFDPRCVILQPIMNIGSWWIAGYTLRLGLGICLSLIWLWYAAPLFHINRQYLAKWCWLLALIALVTGRCAYGLMHKAYFLQNPFHLFQLHRYGGIHGESALIGTLAGLCIWAKLRHKRGLWGKTELSANTTQSFTQLLALCTPAILCVTAGAWWACMQAGCASGWVVDMPNPRARWLLTNGPDLYHTIEMRYPVQLMGSVWAFTLAWISTIRAPQTYHGLCILAIYCLGAGTLTLLRGDAVPTLGGLRIDTVENLGIAFALGGTQVWQILRIKLVN